MDFVEYGSNLGPVHLHHLHALEAGNGIRAWNLIPRWNLRGVSLGKEAFYRQSEMDLADAYSYASEVMTYNLLKDDAAEGIGAFVEKRTPEWSNR